MRSIRSSFVLGGLASVCAILLVSATLIALSVDRSLKAQHEEFLRRELASVSRLLEYDEDEGEVRFEEEDLETDDFRDDLLYVTDPEGNVLFESSENLPELPPTTRDVLAFDLLHEGQMLRVVGRRLAPRVDTLDFEPGEAPESASLGEYSIYLGRPNRFREPFLKRFREFSVAILVGALLLTAGSMLWLGNSSLRGLDRLARSITQRQEDLRDEPISETDVPSEALAIVRRLNALLVRVQHSIRRERELSADVAHELRTPLSGMRATLEVGLQRPRNPDEQREIGRSLLGIIAHTEEMVENLLCLHRAESGQLELDDGEFDLCESMREQLARRRSAIEARGISVQTSFDESVPVRSSRNAMGILIACLLDNAIHHSDGRWIRIEVVRPGEFRMGNPGSRVGPEELPRLFERFARGNGARNSTSGHVGLGLTLAQQMAHLLGTELRLSSERGGEFWACLRLGAQPPIGRP